MPTTSSPDIKPPEVILPAVERVARAYQRYMEEPTADALFNYNAALASLVARSRIITGYVEEEFNG